MRLSAMLMCLWALAASASDVGAELTAGGTRATVNNPRSGYAGALLNGAWDINDTFGLNGAVGFTHDNGTMKGDVDAKGSNIWLFQLAADALLSDHFLLSAGLTASPASTGQSATTITADIPRLGRTETVPALISTTSSSLGGILMLAFGTHGDGKWEHSLNASTQLMRFGVAEKLTPDLSGLPLKDRVTAKEVEGFCANHLELPGCRVLTQPQNASLLQARLQLAYIATLFGDNDVGLDFSYYLYDHDPTETGFFSVATFGRISLGDTPNAIAPIQWTLKPSYVHRFGKVTLKLWVQYGQYVPGQGYDTAAGAKLEWKITRHWKVYVLGQGQRDVDASGNGLGSGSGVLGATWTF
ncbi:MAG: hypothetical protein QM723_25705 [Myxococcaceae bacterium]